MPHITQLCVHEPQSRKTFSRFVLPKIQISEGAEEVTKICVQQTPSGPIMLSHGIQVEHCSITQAVKDLIAWLRTNNFKNNIMIAHNGRKFDFPILMHSLDNIGMVDEFCAVVQACADSLKLVKLKLPRRSSYAQEELVREVLQKSYNAHDAVADVIALSELLTTLKVAQNELMKNCFPTKDIYMNILFNREKERNIKSLEILQARSVMKRPTCENAAGSGLSLKHLRLIHKRQGEDGLRDTFVGKNSAGRARVTACKRTLEDVIPKLCEYFEK